MKALIIVLAATLAGFPASLPDAFAQPVAKSVPVPHVSGGIGEAERSALLAAQRDYNLKLTFAAKAGNYLADVAVRILAADGATVLEAVADGPLLLARLPAGRYRVSATADGQEQMQEVSVPATGMRSLVLRW